MPPRYDSISRDFTLMRAVVDFDSKTASFKEGSVTILNRITIHVAKMNGTPAFRLLCEDTVEGTRRKVIMVGTDNLHKAG